MDYICFAGTCAVSIDCPKELSPSRYLYDEFRQHWRNTSSLPVVGKITYSGTLVMPPSVILLHDSKLYADGTSVYCVDGASIVRIDLKEEMFSLTISSCTKGHLLLVVLQSLLNWYIPYYGLIFLHTASFRYHDIVYAIHGFGGAGKTETMIEALQRGAQYISDDLAIYGQDGSIYPYFRKIAFHDYPFKVEQLEKFHLDKRSYRLMKWCEIRKDKFSNYLYRRLRGRFNISVSPLEISSSSVTLSVEDPIVVSYNYWLDSSNKTTLTNLTSKEFIDRMAFCMENEFRSYVDFDGYLNFLFPFWGKKRTEHERVLQRILSSIDIQGLSINGSDYTELANLILS